MLIPRHVPFHLSEAARVLKMPSKNYKSTAMPDDHKYTNPNTSFLGIKGGWGVLKKPSENYESTTMPEDYYNTSPSQHKASPALKGGNSLLKMSREKS